MVQASSVFLVATAAIYAASPVVGAGIPKAIGKDLTKAVEGHRSHPADHNLASAHKTPGHEHEQQHDAVKPKTGSKKFEKPGDKHAVKGAKPGKHELGHEHGGHQHSASRLGQRPGDRHDAHRNGKDHHLGSQEHGHEHESNRHESGKGRLGSQKNRLSEHGSGHAHEHERLDGHRGAHDSHSLSGERGRFGDQRRPGEEGRGHERLSHSGHSEYNRPGRESRLGHEHPEAGSHSRPHSQYGRPEGNRLGHERLAHPATGRPPVGAPSSRLSARPPPSNAYRTASQGAIKNEIDSLYRLEGRDWDEEDLFIREPMDWEDDLYIRDFDDLEDLYARVPGGKGGKKSRHGHKKHHHHHKQKNMLAAQQAAAQVGTPTDPSEATEQPPSTRGWYDDDLLEFAQRSYYDFYDELD